MNAWAGLVAEGPAELNLGLVRGDETPVEIIRLAYGMEMGLGIFYRTMADRVQDEEVVNLLKRLASIEEKHKQYLLDLHHSVDTAEIDRAAFEAEASSKMMEGGFDLDDFLNQNEKYMQAVPGLLDIAMMLETQAMDLYLRFSDKIEDKASKAILLKIGDEEKSHLAMLGRLREERT